MSKVEIDRRELQGNSLKPAYHFIDFIRLISIIGITSLHSIFFGLPKNVAIEDFLKQTDHPLLFISFLQLMRFSVISFCMITGFLLAGKVRIQGRFKLFYNRVRGTLPPYIIAFLLTAAYMYFFQAFKKQNPNLFSIFHQELFDSAFWYIPANLIALLLILLLLKKLPPVHLGSLLFIALITTTIRYVYITPRGHADPVFFVAFSFYIWLGGMFWKHNVVRYIKKINVQLFFFLWLLCFVLACSETYILWQNNYPITIQNLKISNQIYALVSFSFLIRISQYIKPFSIINPRKETYGIYLYSSLVGLVVGILLHKTVGYFNSNSAAQSIGYTLLHFIATFIATVITVKFMFKYKLMFLNRH